MLKSDAFNDPEVRPLAGGAPSWPQTPCAQPGTNSVAHALFTKFMVAQMEIIGFAAKKVSADLDCITFRG